MDKYIDRLYGMSADFRAYVDRYCSDYGYTVEEALGHALIYEAAKYYWEKDSKEGVKINHDTKRAYTGDLGNGVPA